MPFLFPTIIPQDERQELYHEVDLRCGDRFLEALSRWKCGTRRSARTLMRIHLGFVRHSLGVSHRLSMNWLHRNAPPLTDASKDRAIREIRDAGTDWTRRATESWKQNECEVTDGNPEKFDVSRLVDEARTCTDDWVQEFWAWTEQGAGDARKASSEKATGNPASKKARRGRRRIYDPIKDDRLVNDWKASQHLSYEAFARKRGLKPKDVERTINRVEARRRAARRQGH